MAAKQNEYSLYLKHAPHLVELRARYKASGLPQVCLACGRPSVELHSRNPHAEELDDLVPTCRRHSVEIFNEVGYRASLSENFGPREIAVIIDKAIRENRPRPKKGHQQRSTVSRASTGGWGDIELERRARLRSEREQNRKWERAGSVAPTLSGPKMPARPIPGATLVERSNDELRKLMTRWRRGQILGPCPLTSEERRRITPSRLSPKSIDQHHSHQQEKKGRPITR